MSGSALPLQELLEVQEHFGLPSPALVEKDFHVVRALAAIAAADTHPFQLVFGGGTALGRAHRLIRRMSEDIDLKIVAEGEPPRSALRRLRDAVTSALQAAGFAFDPEDVRYRESRNQSRYTLFRLPYPAAAPGQGALRPEIQIETALWPLRRPAVILPVTSFVAEAYGRPPELPELACVSVTETAAEKLVALTRRVGAELANAAAEPDVTLVRHIYDLHAIAPHCDQAEIAALALEIMQTDAAAYGNQFPAYKANPLGETLRAVESLATSKEIAARYERFQRAMIYGQQAAFADCVVTLNALAAQLRAASRAPGGG